MRINPYLIHKKNSSALHEAILRRSTLSIGSDRTIADFASHWLKEKAIRVRPRTLIRCRKDLTTYILPKLGKIPLSDLTRGEVARFAADLLERGFAKGTVLDILSVLRQIYFDAMEDGQVFYNPAANAVRFLRLKFEQKQIRPFSRQDTRQFLRFARTHEPHYYPVFLCAVTTGMRRGELLGMRPRDIHFDKEFIEVSSLTKSSKARSVDMSKRLATVLWKYLRWKQARALELEGEKPKSERRTQNELLAEIAAKPLFTGLYGGKFDEAALWGVFQRTLKGAGLRHIRLHDLRHTYASLLLERGENIAYIRDQLGHSSISLTVDTYGHLTAGSNRSAVERLVKSLENTKVHLKMNVNFSKRVAAWRAKKSDHLRNWT